MKHTAFEFGKYYPLRLPDDSYHIIDPDGAVMLCVDGKPWTSYSDSHAYNTAHEANRQLQIKQGLKPDLPWETNLTGQNITFTIARDIERPNGRNTDGTSAVRIIKAGTVYQLKYIEAGNYRLRWVALPLPNGDGAYPVFAQDEITIND